MANCAFHCNRRTIQRGITKVEVVVVCLSLLVLMGLLLPVVNDGRGPARRTQCAARLGELVKSFMMYEMAKKQYPGYLNAYAEDEEGFVKVGTWAIAILPYIEQEPLYDVWADPSTTGEWNRRGGGSSKMNEPFYPRISLFTCAADDNHGDYQAPSSYAVNAGFFPDIQPSSYAGLNPHEIARHSSRPANGVFSNQLPAEIACVYTKNAKQRVLGSRADAPTSSKDVRDGLTHTIAVVESLNADSWAQVGHDGGWNTVDIDGVTYAGDDLVGKRSPRVRVGFVWQYKAQPAVSGVADYKRPKMPSPSQKRTYSPELAIPSSNHTGLFNAAMLGGSVTTISNEIDYRVLQALMTPHTKQSDVPDPSYKLKEDDYE